MLKKWWLSRVCEEFHCRPSQAVWEWDHAPIGLLETIIEFRAFAGAKQLYDHAKTATQRAALPDDPMIALVEALEFAAVREEIAAQQDG